MKYLLATTEKQKDDMKYISKYYYICLARLFRKPWY